VTRAEIALLLTKARVRSGLTQTHLAAAMGTTQPAVARAESGYRLPSIEFIERWAKATGRPITLTLGGSRSRVPSLSERRRMVRAVLGPGRFNPWERNPAPVEAALLEKAGLDRTYFEQLRSSGGRSQSGSKAG
jgi:transcriptional regulator with XRE-family HTH domain